ncbi:LOW QUALITY PROTEIN: Aspartate/glutamate/uridylate kinase [Jimgerdemannia flammicorona]|uniref:Aspartate/glutamate/uridylate kinase n=2 Tax=Jimgerdemannia flammicorona TaxID=994334 RepID=A0A433CXW7_9FUNG|nr:LOW QUALITY PROTEIN: Aspartate/glutamate/uridylate kinase [Jimgerdemannia flammicorona]
MKRRLLITCRPHGLRREPALIINPFSLLIDCSGEIRFGDNDTLSAITAGMVKADYLFLMTDVDCLYTDNPRTNSNAKPVFIVDDIATLKEQVTVSSPGTSLGTGGMVTKLIAADLATAAGVTTIITRGSTPQNIIAIVSALHSPSSSSADVAATATAAPLHTRFVAKPNPLVDRKWWILHGLHTAGTIYVDAGCVRALKAQQRSSLFAAGIVHVEGSFVAQQSARVVHERVDPETGKVVEQIEVGKGLVNYSSMEIARIKGCKSSEIEGILGYADAECVVHRDNMTITGKRAEE